MNMLLGGGIPGLGGLTGGDKKEEGGGDKKQEAEDPEVVQARLEQEERRKDKHRQMEKEREKVRTGIRDKYNIKKKEDIQAEMMLDLDDAGIGGPKKKTPEELAAESGILGQIGLGGAADKAKAAVGGVADTIKGFLPFGK